MWQNATEGKCVQFEPEQCGWVRYSDKIQPLWFDGNSTPSSIQDILANTNDDNQNLTEYDDIFDSPFDLSEDSDEDYI